MVSEAKMSSCCFNYLTIVSENATEMTSLINDRLKNKNPRTGQPGIFHTNIDVIKQGAKGIKCMIMNYDQPNFVWLYQLVTDYPECRIWNNWHTEGGLHGVWIGHYQVETSKPEIRNIQWQELTNGEKNYYFLAKIPDV